ncbi:hypothetical protein Vadar_017529 [Vaccinium darrowii]|uniref:Uncharacterized protein n=1 Tax=Vaccinium darrowii TaxID=229202 RepID=A0ACB7XI67_9ERIC|nr:hypothetical protein Vadar_017529 [Vaccinium darrowii]
MGRIPHCHVTLREKLLMDAGAIAGFLTGLRVYLDDPAKVKRLLLRVYLDDPAKVKRLLLPTNLSGGDDGNKVYRNGESSPSVANLQKEIPMTILLIRILNHLQMAVELSASWNLIGIMGNRTCTLSIQDRLDPGTDEGANASTVQKSASLRTKTKCPEQSGELLGLIVNSLRALDGAIPQGCPEPRRMPSLHKRLLLFWMTAPGTCCWTGCFGSNDEPLAATIDFIFKAALQCQNLPEAVRSVRVRLKDLGFEVFPCVLRYLSTRVNSCAGVAEAIFEHTDGIVEGLEEDIEQTGGEGDDFTYVLGLAETLALSGDSHVIDFAKMLYTILLRWYADESHLLRMLKRPVDCATSATGSSCEVDLDLKVLLISLCEEQEIVRPVLSMMREVAGCLNVNRVALWPQLCASEDEIMRIHG